MKSSNITPSAKAAMIKAGDPSHSHLKQIYDEAAKKLEGLFAEPGEQSFSTLMYLALTKLHSAYPHLSHDELEALFMGLVHRRQGRWPRAHH